MRPLKPLVFCGLLTMCLSSASLASDTTLILTGENNSANVDVVDASKLTFQVISSMTATSDFAPVKGIFGLSLDPVSQKMFVIYQPTTGSASSRRLGVIDQTTAAIIDIGLSGNLIDIAFDAQGFLFGTTGSSSPDYSFVLLDQATAAPTFIFTHTPASFGGGMTLNPFTDDIYYQNNSGTSFIDPVTFIETIGSPTGSPGETQAMIILSPTLGWMAHFGTLYTFNPVTEVFSNSGVTIKNYHAFAFMGEYLIGGMVSGLYEGNSLVLQNNLQDDLLITGNGAFVFASPVHVGGDYAVSVLTQPAGPIQNCLITDGSGTVGEQDITDVVVACDPGSDLIFRDGFNLNSVP
jgi:hypothetical protein